LGKCKKNLVLWKVPLFLLDDLLISTLLLLLYEYIIIILWVHYHSLNYYFSYFIIGEIRGVHKLRWQEFAQVLALVITVSLKNKNGKYTNGSTTKPNYWPPIYYPPPVDIFQEILHPRENLHKVEIFSTTHLPCLVHVVCECPKWNYFNKRTFFKKRVFC